MRFGKVYINEENYPQQLKGIKDPPEYLYYVGDIHIANECCVAIVGSRSATEYGRWAAYHLGKRVAESQLAVVSGMAKGIDTCAHKGALTAGKTIAVLGCGIDVCYPPSNRELRDAIVKKGLILSEYPPGTSPQKFMFPRRNRIISGLSESTVVVQAGNNSGALITAELAADQGRNVYAIPGNINNTYHLGSNKLLRDGVIPLVVIDDLLVDMGVSINLDKKINFRLGEEEKRIFTLLRQGGEMTTDQLCRATGQGAAQVNGIITVLEMKGIVYTSLGKIFIAN